ncbi:SpoIIIAH-like family protein [Tuberibacillus sp. Marseille-P3662]|uniref:SpoIIIAH-like family protein n=1 Tax=Tuberibacillus sp. Marseille-P3662 TaxID=1965358 RepID=UPI000A1CE60D|nr:SpoIIIAH-like family protein [Tuberibacillus sp. Marseille-P3662]
MVLKKQTVWLLTMLSLIVVLSVYYVTTPGTGEQLAADDGEKQTETASKDGQSNSKDVTSSIEADSALAELENQKVDRRNEQAQQYQNTITGSDSATKVSEAKANLETLKTTERQETLLEDWVVNQGFSDAVVDTQGQNIKVYVNSKQLSKKQANSIMRKSNEYLGSEKLVKVVRK